MARDEKGVSPGGEAGQTELSRDVIPRTYDLT